MFDPETSAMLRSAPSLPDLDAQDLPRRLTRHYAQLMSLRLRGAAASEASDTDNWPLERIADTYEVITSVHDDASVRRASAFVAGTAQQILARKQLPEDAVLRPHVDREQVDPTIAAALLFLAAEQYADAYEAATLIGRERRDQVYEARIIADHVRDLARGNLAEIIARAGRWRRPQTLNIELQRQALKALLEALICGIELLASQILSTPVPEATGRRFDSPDAAFRKVLELSSHSAEGDDTLTGDLFTTYAGPRHLASLLLSASDGIRDAALTRLTPPDGADSNFWKKWLRHRADSAPFVWPNHRQAIAVHFYETGKSAVVVLPTGAGKTTLSSLKIAGTLARKKKVVFLAPTHALVEQLTRDLQKMFPKDLLGSVVSSDFDLLMLSDTQLKEIEVMTPERCLAMLSFAPTVFDDVGLLVFDECHLLSPQSGKIRRALDSMLCVLAFNHVVPGSDFLFLSAMLKNAAEFADWIAELTARDCVHVDLLWKPSRQARGVVIYQDDEIAAAIRGALKIQAAGDKQAGKRAKGLRTAAADKLVVQPAAIWGLQHNWLIERRVFCSFTPLLNSRVRLTGELRGSGIHLKPNSNKVAAAISADAARNGLKTIVFVNTKNDAVSTASDIATALGKTIAPTEDEQSKWDALELELGDLKHSLLSGAVAAVPHNAAMFRLERELAESMFRRSDGATVIVATPTLAQGLNLPAQLAVLAGDKRASEEGREDLEAHEILNAAARAGRAGHLANGVVLLIPEPIISFSKGKGLSPDVIKKLRAVLPENDRCVTITDPLEVVLDRLADGENLDRDVRYTINRMALLRESEDEDNEPSMFDFKRSLAAYAARRAAEQKEFDVKVALIKKAVEDDVEDGIEGTVFALASKSGLPANVLVRLRSRISSDAGKLPTTIRRWIVWVFAWLKDDEEVRTLLLFDVAGAARASTGRKKAGVVDTDVLNDLRPGIIAWVRGKPINEIEVVLGGDPHSGSALSCPRSREMIGSVIPRAISFILSIVSYTVLELDPFSEQDDLDREVVESLSTAVRLGFDDLEKLKFATDNADSLGRVQAHLAWTKSSRE
ncbi:DEAD/DEAH box helicase [Bradyrhizobium sp. 138]|uniref:DEAD/DEAH box helicase n=1 Tax=Bradyrhizobium sp. 138 TaxID=2782615 RepID=UPI001FF71E92|nr:DEAD/DEAH box helicase [Bradyrhizobium sp. 138]